MDRLLKLFSHPEPPLPRLFFLGGGKGGERLFRLAAWPGVGAADEPVWRRSATALWCDAGCGLKNGDSEKWLRFLDGPGPETPPGCPVAVAVVLDARRLPTRPGWKTREAAALLRSRLLRLGERVGAALPVHILVDNIDAFYGMRSLAALLPPERLEQPLGAIRLDPGETPKEFAARIATEAAAFARETAEENAAARNNPPGGCAAFQAGDELLRLREPLEMFCAEAFAERFDAPLPRLRGLFFGATAPGGKMLPSLLAAFPSFIPEDEAPPPDQPWFWNDAVRESIPEDAARAPAPEKASRRRRVSVAHAGIGALLLGALLLNWLMTFSFWESRGLLLSARGRLTAPGAAEQLGPLLDLSEELRRRNASWRLPRLGMDEAVILEKEARRRFLDGCYELRAAPDIERVQNMALDAAVSTDAARIGDAAALLVRLRLILTRSVTAAFAAAVPAASADAEEMRQLRAYMEAAGYREEWPIKVAERLAEFENYLIENAMGGDPMRWLPGWAESLPGMEPAAIASCWDFAAPVPAIVPIPIPAPGQTPPDRIAAAWTKAGYAAVAALLRAVENSPGRAARNAGDWPARREALLAAYRRRALAEWKSAAGDLWRGWRGRIDDGRIRELLRIALRGDDPAARFAALAGEHLLPMFPAEDADPEILWLRLRGAPDRPDEAAAKHPADREARRWRLALSAAESLPESLSRNLEAARLGFREAAREGSFLPRSMEEERLGNPLAALLDAADAFDAGLRDKAGDAWPELSPAATARFIRFLSVRLAALSLDAMWRERASPSRMETDAAPEKSLERFLAIAASFWRLERGRFSPARWDELAFPFSAAFVDFCSWALTEGRAPLPERFSLPVRIDRVDVNAGARQLPEALELVWRTGGTEKTLAYGNYGVKGELSWTPGADIAVGLRVAFPGRVFEAGFAGREAVAAFLRRFADGAARFGPEDFPGRGAAFAALGVREIIVHAAVGDVHAFLKHLSETPPTAPESIILPLR